MSPRKMTDLFWYRHGVKVAIAAAAISVMIFHLIAGHFDDGDRLRASKLEFLEYRQDVQNKEFLKLKRRMEFLEADVARRHNQKPRQVCDND